ncbi:hypothetical protein H0H92_000518 [Tricholoma furcatifolium]|nr:hypothetical protein H0H92_000518 [Tricholoma furcatifolium]
MPATRNLRSGGPVDDDGQKRPATRATRAKTAKKVNSEPVALQQKQRPRPRKVDKSRPVADSDEAFLSNRHWSSASHADPAHVEEGDNDDEPSPPPPMQPPNRPSNIPPPNSQPLPSPRSYASDSSNAASE